VTQRPANSEILDTSLIAPRGKVLIKPPTVTETIKPEEFDWNCNDNLFTEEFIAPESVIAANQGINAVFADVIVPEIVNEEESIEIEVPVVQVQEAFEEVVEKKKTMSLDQVWSGDSMFEDEMMPVNPYEIHGDAPVNVDPTVDEAEVDDNDMDLLKFVLDDTIQLDDPNVVEWTKTEEVEDDLATIDMGALIGPSTSRDLPEVIKEEPMDFDDPDWTTEEPEKKRGRGRPRIPRPYPEPPKRPRGRPPTAATVAVINEYDSSTMSEGDQKLVKYRRMRDLNNAASKRCRVNRKRKFEVMEDELSLLERRNITLKTEVDGLEARVEKAKKIIFAMVQKKNQQNNDVTSTSTASRNEVEAANVVSQFDLDAFVNAEIDKY